MIKVQPYPPILECGCPGRACPLLDTEFNKRRPNRGMVRQACTTSPRWPGTLSQIRVSGSVCRPRSCRRKAAFVKNESPKATAVPRHTPPQAEQPPPVRDIHARRHGPPQRRLETVGTPSPDARPIQAPACTRSRLGHPHRQAPHGIRNRGVPPPRSF